MFTQFDIVVSVITLFFIILGFFNGAIKTVFSIGKWVGSWYITTRFYPQANEFVGSFMQPGMIANVVTTGGLFLASLIGISMMGMMLTAIVSGTIGGSFDKALGIGLGLVEGFLIASIIHYCVLLMKNGETPEWLAEGQTYQYTSKGSDLLSSLLKDRLDSVKTAYNDNISVLADMIKEKNKYDMGAVNNKITTLSKGGKSNDEISKMLADPGFMKQFLKVSEAMRSSIHSGSTPATNNLMKDLTNGGSTGLELDPDKAD